MKTKKKRGRPERKISAEIRRVYVSLLGRGLSLAEAAAVTGIPASTWADAAKRDPTLKAAAVKPTTTPIPADFNLEAALKSIVPEVFYGLLDAARTEKGIARLTALSALKTWAMESETAEEPYALADARPDQDGKIINFAEAV